MKDRSPMEWVAQAHKQQKRLIAQHNAIATLKGQLSTAQERVRDLEDQLAFRAMGKRMSDLIFPLGGAVERIELLEAALREVYEAAGWQADDEADPEDKSPKDQVAHVNGLIRQVCRKALDR